MLNETKELNSIAEEEIYYCYWTDNSHCIDEVTNDYMFELADKLTRSGLEGELAIQHRNVFYTESNSLYECLKDELERNRKYA